MKKSKSFSNYGSYLDRKNSLKANPDLLSRNIQRSRERPMQVKKQEAKFIQGFDRVPGRDKLNSFQIFNTRDRNNQTNYEVKDQLVSTRNAFYPVRRESEVRLNKLIPLKQKYEQAEYCCEKLGETDRDEDIMTTRDLQKTRRSFHNMDFSKQGHRSHSYIKNPEGRETFTKQESELFMKSTGGLKVSIKDPMNKTNSVHSFDSYTKRNFLSEKNLIKKGAPPFSGAEAHTIPQQKFKGSWKVVNPVKFGTMPNKHLSRYDRDCESWNTKLQYEPKQQLVKKKTPVMEISKQTSRVANEVHSKYPIRLAI